MWPFTKKDYTKDSIVSASSFVESSFEGQGAGRLTVNDSKYTRLSKSSFKAMTERYAPVLSEYKTDIFDCDDGAVLSLAGMIKGANQIGIKAPLAFGVVSYTRKDGIGHMMNIAFSAEGDIMYYDPFQRKWFEQLPDMAKVDAIQL